MQLQQFTFNGRTYFVTPDGSEIHYGHPGLCTVDTKIEEPSDALCDAATAHLGTVVPDELEVIDDGDTW